MYSYFKILDLLKEIYDEKQNNKRCGKFQKSTLDLTNFAEKEL